MKRKQLRSVWIRELRERHNMTQSEFADLLGVHQQTIVWWETGKREPSATALFALRSIEKDIDTKDKRQRAKSKG